MEIVLFFNSTGLVATFPLTSNDISYRVRTLSNKTRFPTVIILEKIKKLKMYESNASWRSQKRFYAKNESTYLNAVWKLLEHNLIITSIGSKKSIVKKNATINVFRRIVLNSWINGKHHAVYTKMICIIQIKRFEIKCGIYVKSKEYEAINNINKKAVKV